mmetsp:Transcript_30064/g.22325  ORF Transcript_30064/g.22325 Transcript_30064/m.22325 type:complete len:108 (-) Transcript_30064:111-434(-)
MTTEIYNLIPGITIGKVLIQRDEASKDKTPVFLYLKLPSDIAQKKRVFILDPMLATGGSACLCIQKLLSLGVKEENITFINLISCPEGLSALEKKYPGVNIITGVVD